MFHEDWRSLDRSSRHKKWAPIMQIPSTVSIWLSEQAWPIALVFLLIAGILVSLYVSARNRRVKMNEVRSGVNEDTFVRAMEIDGFDHMIARTTYRYLQEKQNVSFPIHSDDLLDEDLGLGGDDVDESVEELLGECGRLYQPGLQHMPIVTVEDLVRFLQASPRLSEMAA